MFSVTAAVRAAAAARCFRRQIPRFQPALNRRFSQQPEAKPTGSPIVKIALSWSAAYSLYLYEREVQFRKFQETGDPLDFHAMSYRFRIPFAGNTFGLTLNSTILGFLVYRLAAGAGSYPMALLSTMVLTAAAAADIIPVPFVATTDGQRVPVWKRTDDHAIVDECAELTVHEQMQILEKRASTPIVLTANFDYKTGALTETQSTTNTDSKRTGGKRKRAPIRKDKSPLHLLVEDTVPSLKAQLRERSLPVYGSREQLVRRVYCEDSNCEPFSIGDTVSLRGIVDAAVNPDLLRHLHLPQDWQPHRLNGWKGTVLSLRPRNSFGPHESVLDDCGNDLHDEVLVVFKYRDMQRRVREVAFVLYRKNLALAQIKTA